MIECDLSSRAMPQPSQQSPSAARLAIAVGGALLAVGAVLAAVLALLGARGWWSGLVAAALVSALSAGLSLPALAYGLPRNAQVMVACYFTATAVRLVVSLGGCLLAVFGGQYPMAPTLLLMVPFYLAVLAVETGYTARAMWNARIE